LFINFILRKQNVIDREDWNFVGKLLHRPRIVFDIDDIQFTAQLKLRSQANIEHNFFKGFAQTTIRFRVQFEMDQFHKKKRRGSQEAPSLSKLNRKTQPSLKIKNRRLVEMQTFWIVFGKSTDQFRDRKWQN
jgi:hypothetical protein